MCILPTRRPTKGVSSEPRAARAAAFRLTPARVSDRESDHPEHGPDEEVTRAHEYGQPSEARLGVREIEQWMLVEALPDADRAGFGSLDPRNMGGEYPPRVPQGRSRDRQGKDGVVDPGRHKYPCEEGRKRIAYRIVDEYVKFGRIVTTR